MALSTAFSAQAQNVKDYADIVYKSPSTDVSADPGFSKWRALNMDDDLCPATFKKGKNHLLLKVQNMEYDWSYSCRILPPESYTENLAASARRGDLDNMELLLSNGAEVDAKTKMGLTQ